MPISLANLTRARLRSRNHSLNAHEPRKTKTEDADAIIRLPVAGSTSSGFELDGWLVHFLRGSRFPENWGV